MDLPLLDVCVCGVQSKQEPVPVYSAPHHTHTHTHTHTPNQELHMQPHLPTFYHNNTVLYCILSF